MTRNHVIRTAIILVLTFLFVNMYNCTEEDEKEIALGTPVNFGVVTITGNNVSLSWETAQNATSYKIYRSKTETGTYDLIASPPGTTYIDETVAPNNTYYYKVASARDEQIGDQSNAISATTPILILHDTDTGTFTKTYNNLDGNDIYFVFTNTHPTEAAAAPEVNNRRLFNESIPPLSLNKSIDLTQVNQTRIPGVGYHGTPYVNRFNANPWDYVNKLEPSDVKSEPFQPKRSELGATATFNDAEENPQTIQATCQLVREVNTAFGMKTVSIWVADDSWHQEGTKTYNMSQEMVDTMADAFLKDGNNNDIYDWISGIYGEEWGTINDPEVISKSDEITILCFDIDYDDSVDGGTLGFFMARDNFRKTSQPNSNERIMFYMDSVLFATPTEATWEITDRWPAEQISTLAHEFQHMIHIYQKTAKNEIDDTSETWLNEMCAMAAEDFVANKLNIPGPRGVTPTDGSAGSANNTAGYITAFNANNSNSVLFWPEAGGGDEHYGIVYAFGAFLNRNYGGANLFQNLVQNNKINYEAITTALASNGFSSESFASVLQKWGVAILISDMLNVPTGYKFNTGDFFTSTVGGIDYSIGSINFYNYKPEGGEAGPTILTSLTSAERTCASNVLYKAGTALSGTQTWNLTLSDPDVKLSVLIR